MPARKTAIFLKTLLFALPLSAVAGDFKPEKPPVVYKVGNIFVSQNDLEPENPPIKNPLIEKPHVENSPAENPSPENPPAVYEETGIQGLGLLRRDTKYYQLSVSRNLELIYSEDFKNYSVVFSDYIRQIDSQLSKVFPFRPADSGHGSVFFPSSRRQVSNASAAVYPFSSVTVYPSGSAGFMDRWSIFYWAEDVLIHEMTHIYQLSQNSKWDRRLDRIIGPISYRNMLLGSFALEGSAVLNESIYGFGGRLFSGWARAFVFSQIKSDLPVKRVLKAYDDPFSTMEKYLHGGYFFAYLQSQYGEEKVNRLFAESGLSLNIGFYALNNSLKSLFGKNLETLFENYKKHYLKMAQRQKSSPEPALLKSKTDLPMNSDESSIYFLISSAKSPPQLIIFDKATKKITQRKINLPLGKVFYKEGAYYSSSNARTSSTSLEYSLFREGFKPLKKYNSQLVMDFRGEKYVSLSTQDNHSQNSLLVNGDFWTAVHSSALMDSKGRVYYFKQNGPVRTLYRDKKPLARLSSYYAYPVEADEEGLYFISSTKYGSSLFVYKEALGIFRLSKSDTISNARKIAGNEFLVSEVGPVHHTYKVISTQETLEKPFPYRYSFEKKNIFEKQGESLWLEKLGSANSSSDSAQNEEVFLAFGLSYTDDSSAQSIHNGEKSPHTAEGEDGIAKELAKEPAEKQPGSLPGSDEEPTAPSLHKTYNSLKNLYLKQVLFLLDPFSSALTGYFQFLDPLWFSDLVLLGSIGPTRGYFDLSYTYRKHRPFISFSLIYDESRLKGQEDRHTIQTLKDIGFLETEDIYIPRTENVLHKRVYIPHRDRAFALSLRYPLLRRAYWGLSTSQSLQWGQMQFHNKELYFGKSFPFLFYKPKSWKNYIQNTGKLRYSYTRKYKYSYSYYSKKVLQLSYDMLFVGAIFHPDNIHLSGQAQAHLMEEFGKEWFVTLNGTVKKKLWDREPQNLFLMTNGDVVFSYGSFKQAFQDLYQLDFQVLKVLNHSFYPSSVLFSMRRWAPLFGLSFLSIRPVNKRHKFFLIPFMGAEWELAMLYEERFFKTGLSGEYVINLSDPIRRPSFQMSFWLKRGF